MNPQAMVAISLALIIGLGSLITAVVLYRSKKAKLPQTDSGERQVSLLHDLESIAAQAEAEAKPKPTFPLEAFADLPTSADDTPRRPTRTGNTRLDTTMPTASSDAWKDWASEPTIVTDPDT